MQTKQPIQSQKNTPQKQYQSVHYSKPNRDQILFDCESKLSLNPLNCDALFTLCNLYYSYSMIDESLAIARQIIAIDPDYSAAHDFLSKNNSDHHESSTQIEDIETLETLAIRHFNNNNYTKAIPLLQQILSMNSNHAPAHRYLAELFTNQKKYSSAIAHLNYLTLLFPSDYRVYYNLAVICYYKGDIKRALSNLNEAYKLCTNDDQFLIIIQDMINTIESNG